MRRSNSRQSLQGEGRTNSSLGENLAEKNNGHSNGLGNRHNNGLAETEVKETNSWDGGRASITFSPHRFIIFKRFQR